ncbi:MAG: C25 family cysteine peptidase [bacterium]
MYRTFALFVLSALTATGYSGNWTPIGNALPAPARISLVSSSVDRSTVHFSLQGFNMREVNTPNGAAFIVELENSTPMLDAGAPDLPKLTASLAIPDQAGMGVRVAGSKYRDFPGMTIAPSKGVIMRDIDPSTVPYSFGSAYSADQFYPGTLAAGREPFIIRDVRGQTLVVYPFQYNPVTKILRVYYDLTVELYKTSDTGENPRQQVSGIKKTPGDIQQVIQHQFLNSDAMSYASLSEYGNLLVICYGPFMNAMQPYADWKRAEGYQTELINRDSAGTTSAQIRSFIANYYSTKGLTHVLLVGDAQQIPTNTGTGLGGPSDNAYGYISGNDHYSDVFIGRFSAENEAQVQTQVQRTLEYEQNPQFLTEDWFSTVIGIASDQGPGDDNEYDYQHVRNQQTQLLAYKYTMNPELFDGSQGGNDATGNPTPPMVAAEVNSGASLILYTGHGSNTSWGTSGFSNSNVNQLTNAGKLPFVWSVACVNGNFTTGTCFAEAWLRASQGGQPTGAIAFLGSTINQSWNSPMAGQDEMTSILAEADSNNIKRTFAGLSINGCMKMIDSYGSDGAAMADTWTVFGDPTIMVRTSTPQIMTVQYDTTIFVGDTSLSVFCNAQGARVTATVSDSILATGLVMNNTVTLTFPPLSMASDTIHLVVTAYNTMPYFGILIVQDAPGPVTAGFTGQPTRVIPGHTVAFADTTTGPATTREWHFPGGTPSVSSEKNPVITYSDKGTYEVTLIAGNGTSHDTITKTGYITCDFPTGISRTDEPVTVEVSPNPNPGKFLLTVRSLPETKAALTVLNLVGAKVYEETLVPDVNGLIQQTIVLPEVAKGIYFLQLKGNSLNHSRKIIIR